jgi:hypothetical protein
VGESQHAIGPRIPLRDPGGLRYGQPPP